MRHHAASSPLQSALPTDLDGMYGQGFCFCPSPNPQVSLVLSQERPIDLYELEQLCDAVGWSRR
ncbi:MAG: N-acetyltransferase, partial [Vulcanococcus sp.]